MILTGYMNKKSQKESANNTSLAREDGGKGGWLYPIFTGTC